MRTFNHRDEIREMELYHSGENCRKFWYVLKHSAANFRDPIAESQRRELLHVLLVASNTSETRRDNIRLGTMKSLQLPTEIHEYIFQFNNTHDLDVLRLVCKSFLCIIDDDAFVWRYCTRAGIPHGILREFYEDASDATNNNSNFASETAQKSVVIAVDSLSSSLQKKRHRRGLLWLKYEIAYDRGKKHGLERRYHENGQMVFEYHWQNGKIHGLARGWQPDGTLWYEQEWLNGVPFYRDAKNARWQEDGLLFEDDCVVQPKQQQQQQQQYHSRSVDSTIATATTTTTAVTTESSASSSISSSPYFDCGSSSGLYHRYNEEEFMECDEGLVHMKHICASTSFLMAGDEHFFIVA